MTHSRTTAGRLAAGVAALAAVVILAAVPLGAFAAGGRANTGAVGGLSDQDPNSFTETVDLHPSPPMQPRTAADIRRWDVLTSKLQLRSARLLIPWNLETQACFKQAGFTCQADLWVTDVQAEGFAPFLVLHENPGSGGALPSPTQYAADFGAIVKHFEALARRNGRPPITLWQSWNEPNVEIRNDPVLAADYWREANAVCRQLVGGCTVVAGEFGSVGGGNYGSGGYVYEYGQELLRPSSRLPPVAYPAIWSEHAYVDLVDAWRAGRAPYRYPSGLKQECTTDLQPRQPGYRAWYGYPFQGADCFVNYFAGTAGNGWDQGVTWRQPQVWLDEEGVVLSYAPRTVTPLDAEFVSAPGDPTPVALNPNYPKPLGATLAGERQIAAARAFLALGTRYPGFVARTYYFAWGPGEVGTSGFDSALLDSSHLPRLVYCVLAGRPAGACNGSRTSGQAPPSPLPHPPSPHCPPTQPGMPVQCK